MLPLSPACSRRPSRVTDSSICSRERVAPTDKSVGLAVASGTAVLRTRTARPGPGLSALVPAAWEPAAARRVPSRPFGVRAACRRFRSPSWRLLCASREREPSARRCVCGPRRAAIDGRGERKRQQAAALQRGRRARGGTGRGVVHAGSSALLPTPFALSLSSRFRVKMPDFAASPPSRFLSRLSASPLDRRLRPPRLQSDRAGPDLRRAGAGRGAVHHAPLG